VKKLLNEYKDFISQGNVITIAIGLVMALYFKSIVDAVINGVIMPIVSAIVGEENFEDIDVGIGDANLEIGLVIQAVIMFIVVAFILFLIVKAYNTYVAKPEEGEPTELDVLKEIRDELRTSR
jgi:large conductance mechanosensitive channel